MSKPRFFSHIAALLLCLVTFGCSDAPADDDDAESDGKLTLRDICNGTYDCVAVRGDGTLATLTLEWRANGCYITDRRVNGESAGDLYILIEDIGASVTGTREAFRTCDADGACVDCYATEASTPGSARCTGNATSCSSIGASSCSLQSGCQYRIGIDTTSTRDDDCGGTARDCDEISSQSSCEAQRGCTWK